ncbi:hypothetical protein CFP56_025603 [Quercus suber]|uniref:Uncharacterized protein n=1 Tax=Quercus suber TaxID=58331 RepID=A0AAW0K417_QUESU
MKVQMNCEKCRTKAMKIAAVAEASLTRSLRRKKLGYATIEIVQKLEGSSAEKKPEKEEDNPTPILWSSSYGQYPQVPLYYAVVSDPYPRNCFTM